VCMIHAAEDGIHVLQGNALGFGGQEPDKGKGRRLSRRTCTWHSCDTSMRC
jgi:hypothetical protein